jgi:hypothetical protein
MYIGIEVEEYIDTVGTVDHYTYRYDIYYMEVATM